MICNAVKHEMYPKIASAIMAIIEDEEKEDTVNSNIYSTKIPLYRIKGNIDKVINHLKTVRKLAIEERNYPKMLIERANTFIPFTKDSQSYVHTVCI